MATHTYYVQNSPTYAAYNDQWGRWLYPSYVLLILEDHSVPLDEYLGDPDIALGALPSGPETDLLPLMQWLGY